MKLQQYIVYEITTVHFYNYSFICQYPILSYPSINLIYQTMIRKREILEILNCGMIPPKVTLFQDAPERRNNPTRLTVAVSSVREVSLCRRT